MRFLDLLFETTVYDVRHSENSLEYWPKGQYDYIDPDNGFYFHYGAASVKSGDPSLVIHSTPNCRYSTTIVHGPAVKGKQSPVPFLWNNLNGLVNFATKTITIFKENYADTKYRQRVLPDIKHFQKAIKALKHYGVTNDFSLKGVPPHIPKTVEQVLQLQDYTDLILSDKPPIMYHGTSWTNAQIILEKGLRPGHTPDQYVDLVPGYSEHNIYLSTTAKAAEFYAKRACKKSNTFQPGAILAIRIPDPAKLLADDQYIPRNYPNRNPQLSNQEIQNFGSEKKRLSWSGREGGEFAYRGIIRPSFIKLFRKVNFNY